MAKTKLQEVVEDIERIAKDLTKDPWRLTARDYYGNGGDYTEWDLRKLGGLPAILADTYALELQKDLPIARGVAVRTRYANKLERELGDWQYWTEQFQSSIRKALREFPIQVSVPTKQVSRRNSTIDRETIVHISDTHIGLDIDGEEVESGSYNWQIAARRLGLLAQEVASYKSDHRDECGRLIVNFAGDLIQGIIHAEDHNADLITMQLVGAARYLIAFLDFQLQNYSKVLCPVTTDNHARIISPVKGKDRARAQKYDSFNTIMFEIVQQAFRNNPNIQFLVPKTPYTTYKVFGRPFWTTHGDTVIDVGNVGKTIDIGKIVAKIDAINSVIDESSRMQVLLTGHVHTGLHLGLDSGVDLFINPSMSGIDPYAQSLGHLRPSRPGQWLFESTRDHKIGDSRLVSLSSADDDKSFEKIIPTFTGTLTLEK